MVTRLIILLALIAVLVGGCVWQERRVSAAQTDRDAALQAKRRAEAERDSAKGSTTVVTQYVDRVQIVREAGATITREIPIYVTQKADADCTIPSGFVRLHDAAATGNPTGRPPEILMRRPPALRSLPSPVPSPTTTPAATPPPRN